MKYATWFKAALWAAVLIFLLTSCGFINPVPGKEAGKNEPDGIINGDPGDDRPGDEEQPTLTPEPAPTVTPGQTGKTAVKIRAVGDIMMHGPQVEAGLKDDGTYDFDHFFEHIRPYLENADITIGNLETTISNDEKGYGGYPMFRTPEAILDALAKAGFDIITTANNHSFDGREFGVVNTLDKLDEYGFLHTGTARTEEERDNVLIVEKNDIRIAILAYTYGTNGMEVTIPDEKLPYMVNYIDEALIREDIGRAREAGAEIIIASMHWGDEYVRKPNDVQKGYADLLGSLGVDIILGSHPHVLQPMEKRTAVMEDGTEKEIFVIYSLGNFISNQRDRYKDSGVILDIEIIKDYDAGTVQIGRVGYIPTWVHRFVNNGRSDYNVLPVAGYKDGGLSGEAGERINAVWNETVEHLGDEFEVIETEDETPDE